MKISRLLCIALSIVVATCALYGCTATEPLTPVPGSMGASAERPSHVVPTHAYGRDLLYVTYGEDVNVYTYPGGKLLGSLGNVGGSLCSDRYGNVFDSQYYQDDVLEYAHGAAMPKATLEDPTFAGACSVDPITESVAVTSGGGVVIFPYTKKYGWRFAKSYAIPNMQGASFCGYDASGNLFADGGGASSFAFAELPKGAKSFKAVTLNQSIARAGPIQWDGTYLTVAHFGAGSTASAVIYQFRITGSAGIEAGSTTLSDSYGDSPYWIHGDRVVGPYRPQKYVDGVAIWAYPAGGSPLKNFASGTGADDVTVSVAPAP